MGASQKIGGRFRSIRIVYMWEAELLNYTAFWLLIKLVVTAVCAH
jgi:hypothetical protein